MDDERYVSVEMSIIGSLLEVREMQAGRLPKPTPEDFFAHIDEMVEQEKMSEKGKEDFQMEHNKDYISVEQSIIGSLIEVKAMQAGRLPKKTWKEFLDELRAEDEREERNANHIDAQLRS